jgi:hypothetical protein
MPLRASFGRVGLKGLFELRGLSGSAQGVALIQAIRNWARLKLKGQNPGLS